jgi:hypothetical protein
MPSLELLDRFGTELNQPPQYVRTAFPWKERRGGINRRGNVVGFREQMTLSRGRHKGQCNTPCKGVSQVGCLDRAYRLAPWASNRRRVDAQMPW